MSRRKIGYVTASMALIAATSVGAEPMHLTPQQMDAVTAGAFKVARATAFAFAEGQGQAFSGVRTEGGSDSVDVIVFADDGTSTVGKVRTEKGQPGSVSAGYFVGTIDTAGDGRARIVARQIGDGSFTITRLNDVAIRGGDLDRIAATINLTLNNLPGFLR